MLFTSLAPSGEWPAWTFGQILYIKKEGFFEALKAARWPERYDCALVTSKGYIMRCLETCTSAQSQDS